MTEHDKLREAIKRLKSPVEGITPATVDVPYSALQTVLAAAESTLPKTKMVEVWHVEGSTKGGSLWVQVEKSREKADEYLAMVRRDPNHHCIRVTGPHMQEVPCD